MIDLDFAVTGAEIARRTAAPTLLLKLHLASRTPDLPIEHVMLQAQVRIEAARRDYSPRERAHLAQLFGGEGDWGRGLRGLLWTNASLSIPAFADSTTVDLPLPCSSDVATAVSRYFDGIEAGEAPLLLLFSGTVFFRDDAGDLQITQIAHHKEAGYRLPAGFWQAVMDYCYPDTVWLPISRGLFERVKHYTRHRGLATPEEALQRLLSEAEAEAAP